MIIFENYSKPNSEPKYYSMSSYGNFAYSHKKDLDDWTEYNEVNNNPNVTGKLKDLKEKYDLIDWKRKEGNTRGYETKQNG